MNGECLVKCQIAVVAIHNSTIINILLPMSVNLTIDGTMYTRSETVVLHLDQYQTYEIQSKYDLTGTRIRSNEPIAVFSGNKKTRFREGTKDHLVEQLIPVESLGRSFTVIPTPNQGELGITYFKVIATVSNTKVDFASFGSSEQHVLAEPGDWFEVEANSDQYYYVTSTKPIMLRRL
ncbi:IgGFc-binding protein-like [Patella vulgata]|uniref:IgGFc-binding protein-like n=1 Tax=Patella vulgata TaxID=6465 RepID=UPI0021802D5C|nr:IgGFc-binding protein-like [Patella vulgata]